MAFSGVIHASVRPFFLIAHMHPSFLTPAPPVVCLAPPADAAAWLERGHLWHQAGDPGQAAACYQQATRLDPQSAQAWFNLGVTRTITGELDSALDAYDQAIAHRPRFARAYNNAAILHQTRGDYARAERDYTRAIQADPRYVDPHYNSGLLAFAQADYPRAERAYRKALQLAPAHAEARNNLGHTWLELGRPREARRAFETVLATKPNHPEARWNLGFTQLLFGDYEPGWQNYEWRFTQPGRQRAIATPRWTGAPLEGQSLLVWNEQGLGDAIQFARFLPPGSHFETPAPLARLFSSLGCSLTPPTEAQWQVPLLSLPAILGTRLDTLPPAPYLSIGEPEREKFRLLLADLVPPGNLRIGLAWSGNPRHHRDRQRSLPPELIPTLTAGLPGISFLSVQHGAPPPGVLSLDDRLTDFADTAGLMANLDLTISVDTAAAHLAGALGLPVWVLLSYAPDFRWMLDREDSPWYPTMRLFRQRRLGDWGHLLGRVRRELPSHPLSRP